MGRRSLTDRPLAGPPPARRAKREAEASEVGSGGTDKAEALSTKGKGGEASSLDTTQR